MTSTPPAPLAFSGSRLSWADLPRSVRRRIAEMAGAEVISESSATSGFSPGYAALLGLADGTEVFVKAVSPEQNPDSPDLARAEIHAAEHIPDTVCAPELRWSDDDGVWVILGFAAIEGRTPETPWRPDELARVLDAVAELAEANAPSSGGLPALRDTFGAQMGGWSRVAADEERRGQVLALAGPHGPWVSEHLTELCSVEATAADAVSGSSLVHGDLRADNVMLGSDDRRVWLIDWPHACGDGARWFDLLAMLPSVAMQGGGNPADIFWAHPTSVGADPEAVRAALVGITGYFLEAAVRPPPPGIVNLRAFQAAQGLAALAWLTQR